VQVVEQTGHENIVVLKLGDLRITGRTPAAQLWRPGEPVRIGFDAARAHVFAAGPTGRRLNVPAPARPALVTNTRR
jgi:ABC-type sugar transport system ATPase subunit